MKFYIYVRGQMVDETVCRNLECARKWARENGYGAYCLVMTEAEHKAYSKR